MATIRPGTRSKGFLVLPYQANGANHRMAVRFNWSLNPRDATLIPLIAYHLAELVQACVPNTIAMSRFEVYDLENSFMWGGLLDASLVGTHAVSLNMKADKSQTIAFTGKGIAGADGYAVGQCRLTFRVSNAYDIAPGTKRLPFDAALLALANYLAFTPNIWCDFYGQKAIVRDGVTVQKNAHIQRVEGQ